MLKKKKVSLVKINSDLYKLLVNFVKEHKLEYPSIKYFVENAVMRAIGFKKYDIEGIDADSKINEPLEKVVHAQGGGYTICFICSKLFFKKDIEAERICPKCRAVIFNLAKELSKNNKQKKIKSE